MYIRDGEMHQILDPEQGDERDVEEDPVGDRGHRASRCRLHGGAARNHGSAARN
jgi:hypothetical protein